MMPSVAVRVTVRMIVMMIVRHRRAAACSFVGKGYSAWENEYYYNRQTDNLQRHCERQ
jgi:hypothetical protein